SQQTKERAEAGELPPERRLRRQSLAGHVAVLDPLEQPANPYTGERQVTALSELQALVVCLVGQSRCLAAVAQVPLRVAARDTEHAPKGTMQGRQHPHVAALLGQPPPFFEDVRGCGGWHSEPPEQPEVPQARGGTQL